MSGALLRDTRQGVRVESEVESVIYHNAEQIENQDIKQRQAGVPAVIQASVSTTLA